MKKGTKIVLIAISALLIAVVATVCGFVFSGNLNLLKSFFGVEDDSVEAGVTDVQDIVRSGIDKPGEIKGIWLVYGKDFANGSESDLSAVDSAISDIKNKGFNTIFLDVNTEGQAVVMAEDGTDIIDSVIKKAQENGIFVVNVIDAKGVINISDVVSVDESRISALCTDYNFDAIMLKDLDGLTFYEGSVLTQEEKTNYISSAVKKTGECVKSANKRVIYGVEASPVWANSKTDVRGSDTDADYEMLTDGNCDVLSWINEKSIDFIYADGNTTMSSTTAKYETVMKWWSESLTDTGIELWAGHLLSNVGAGMDEWKNPDEITAQLVVLENVANIKGDIFYSYSALVADAEGAATRIMEYYAGGINTSFALKELVITNRESFAFTTSESKVDFIGGSDPDFPVTCDGNKVEQDENGYFSVTKELSAGKNTVTFEHKGKVLNYTVTYSIEVLKNIEPTGTIKADGGGTLEISAVARKGAKVYAKINGTNVTLSEAADDGQGSDFANFFGKYTLPSGSSSENNLGKIVVYASYNGHSASKTGGKVVVNAIVVEQGPIVLEEYKNQNPDVAIPTQLTPYTDSGTGKTARMCEITSEYVETIPMGADDKSHPGYVPMIKGTFDYITSTSEWTSGGETKTFFILASGRRIYQKDAKEISNGYALPANSIKAYSTSTSSDSTDIVITTLWKVPYSVTLNPQAYEKETAGVGAGRVFKVSSFTAEYIDIKFSYTTSASGEIKTSGSNVVKSAEWINVNQSDGYSSCSTLRIYLQTKGHFYGYKISYNSDGTLKISVKNRNTSLSGVTVMLDAGHGGKDPGALGVIYVNGSKAQEADVNLAIAKKTKGKLESLGATVIMTRSDDSFLELADRVLIARRKNPDVFVSIHCDSTASGNSARGSTSYYYRSYSKALGQCINNEIANSYANNGYSKGGKGSLFFPFAVTRLEECPAVLVECGYMNNQSDCTLLLSSGFQDSIATAITNGISNYIKNN